MYAGCPLSVFYFIMSPTVGQHSITSYEITCKFFFKPLAFFLLAFGFFYFTIFLDAKRDFCELLDFFEQMFCFDMMKITQKILYRLIIDII